MRVLSLFSGIEAVSVAVRDVPGVTVVGFAEIEPFPCAVLEHHYPEVPNLGDVSKITATQIEDLGPIDMIVGGFPCQDCSIAGKRKGLKNDDGSLTRSGLFFEAMRLLRVARERCGLRFVLIENVPGLFSLNGGRDFGTVVAEICGCPFDVPSGGWQNTGVAAGPDGMVEWCVLDSQWFGVAQRRRRVFALGDFGDWADRAPILFERESLQGNPPPSRGTREGAAAGAEAGAGSRGRHRSHWNGGAHPPLSQASQTRGGGIGASNQELVEQGGAGLIPALSVALRGRDGGATAELGDDLAHALRASQGGGDKPHVLAYGGNNTAGPIDVATARNAHGGPHGRLDFETETFVLDVKRDLAPHGSTAPRTIASPLTATDHKDPQIVCVTGEQTHALTAEGFDASEDGTGRGHPIVPQPAWTQDVADPITAHEAKTWSHEGTGNFRTRNLQAVAFAENSHAELRLEGGDGQTTGALKVGGGKPGQSYPAIAAGMAIRRLTPKEAERLQGFPDGYTDVPFKAKSAADGPRYRSLGNSMTVPVMAYILRQIERVMREQAEEQAGGHA